MEELKDLQNLSNNIRVIDKLRHELDVQLNHYDKDNNREELIGCLESVFTQFAWAFCANEKRQETLCQIATAKMYMQREELIMHLNRMIQEVEDLKTQPIKGHNYTVDERRLLEAKNFVNQLTPINKTN